MKTLEMLFTNPMFVTFMGWFAWNAVLLSMFKDDNESQFKLFGYAKDHWDNWLASFAMIPVLLFIGYSRLNVPLLTEGQTGWYDFYYLGSGFATELVIVNIKKWRKKQQG